MTINPLVTGREGGGSGDLPPGDTRIIDVKDKSGNVIKTITVYRTEREYIYDLCDAYNASRSAHAKGQGIECYAAGGSLHIGHSFESMRANARRIESRNETERARFIRHQLDNA
jgi:hypothetical protein